MSGIIVEDPDKREEKSIIAAVLRRFPAPDIFIGSDSDDFDDVKPVAFFAEVTIVDTRYLSIPQNKIIAVSLDEYQEDLIGKDSTPYEYQELVHKSKFERLR